MGSDEDKPLFKKILKCLEDAKEHFLSRRRFSKDAQRASELIEEIEKYMHYEGSADLPNLFDQVIGEEDAGSEGDAD